MKYQFNLEWDDLDEDLREQKITEYIENGYQNGEYDQTKDIADVVDDLSNRKEAEHIISSYFPMYF